MKKTTRRSVFEFIRYAVAGNVFFWVTYIGYLVLRHLFDWPEAASLATASIIAHIIYFALDKEWVFSKDKKRRKTGVEFTRFGAFMAFNYFLNLGIVLGLSQNGIIPEIGQFISAWFFTLWNWIGFKYWVFKPDLIKRSRNARTRRV